MTEATPGVIEADAVVIGAGPVGLFQVFQLGLLEVKAHVIDALAYAGGQCVELYPDKPIYDIPAVSVCTGRELTTKLLQQIEPFGATFHFNQEVSVVRQLADQRFYLETSNGTRFVSKTVFIAAGVGAFQPRTLRVDGIEKFAESQLCYEVKDSTRYAGKNLVVLGGDDAAIDWALHFCAAQEDGNPHKAESVVLLHRRDSFKASTDKLAAMRGLCEAKNMQLLIGQISGFEESQGKLTHIKVTGTDAVTRLVPLDVLLVFLGLSPKLGPIADWGLDIDRKQLTVDTETFSTSVPGIFAVGDINTYPGKKKLILCGFHECALAAFGAMPIIFPEKKVLLQYTTTSPKLHKLLGVESPTSD
jgi:thioredoxin reductase (NADPH)